MIPELGHFALIVALLTALVQGTLPMLGAAMRQDPLRQWFWFGPTSSSRRDRNSLRIGEVFDLL